MNALYDIQANGLSYEGEGMESFSNQQTPGAARTSNITSGAKTNFGENF